MEKGNKSSDIRIFIWKKIMILDWSIILRGEKLVSNFHVKHMPSTSEVANEGT